MHAGGHHDLADSQAAGHDHRIAIGTGHPDRLHAHRHARLVDQPHRRLALLLRYRRQRQLGDAFHPRQLDERRRRATELYVGLAEIGFHEERARRRVSRGCHFTHRGRQRLVAAPQLDLERARLAGHRTHAVDRILGHREDGVAWAVMSEAEHGRAAASTAPGSASTAVITPGAFAVSAA